jgi:hypothetical protein
VTPAPQATATIPETPAIPATETPAPAASGPAASSPKPAPASPGQSGAAKTDGALFTALINNHLALGGLALAVLGLAAFLLVRRLRRLHRSPNRAVAAAARGRSPDRDILQSKDRPGRAQSPEKGKAPSAPPARETPLSASKAPAPRAAEAYQPPRRESPYADTGGGVRNVNYGSPFMLKLFVADQNTLIGMRNTHLVKPGFSYTVGGGKSDFLIFLVPVPQNIGEVKYESSGCTFYPRKPAYFPDLGNNPVRDCVGKTIRVVSGKGYELFIRLEQYEDPLRELNRLMLSINAPNPADGK